MNRGEYTSPGRLPVDPARLIVATSLGIAFIPDEAVKELTAGHMTPPGAVLLFEAIHHLGTLGGQMLMTADMAAAVHGSLAGWRDELLLPVRDQYDARLSESHTRYAKAMGEWRSGL